MGDSDTNNAILNKKNRENYLRSNLERKERIIWDDQALSQLGFLFLRKT